MGVINQLSFEVANLIAAGEVVDRPASAIKELMENAIDARAKHITVETKHGGVTFMRVSDDGCGMDGEDLPMAIRRHATSKISSADDLDGICTLGFRGEALAAISSVSKLRIISKKADSVMGAVLDVDHGEIVGLNEQGCSDGTTVIAEELFSNVPARRKFLKRDVTETSFICTNVEKVALSHPEIAIRLICDGQIRLESVGDGELKNTIYSIFGKDFASKLIAVDSEYEGIRVHGFIGRSDNVKGNRGAQNFYINNRYIKSKTATAALEQAYSSYLPSERFPVCILFIDMSPGRVDVNVHPAKLEVKFSNEKPVFEAVYYAVKQSLETSSYRPEIQPVKKPYALNYTEMQAPVVRDKDESHQLTLDLSFKKQDDTAFKRLTAEEYLAEYVKGGKKDTNITVENKNTEFKAPVTPKIREEQKIEKAYENIEIPPKFNEKSAEYKSSYSAVSASESFSNKENTDAQASEDKISDKIIEENENAEELIVDNTVLDINTDSVKTKTEISDEPKSVWKYIGEAFNSYLICEVDDKLLLIDKHAAHERIIFESLKANMYKYEGSSQMLMIPIEVMLMSDEITCIEEYRHELESVGFGFSTHRNTAYISEIPQGIDPSDVPAMFSVFAERLKSGTGNVSITKNILFEKALYQASCKAAIKAGREYPDGHHKWIIKKLMEIPDITVCPHGRPVAMELSHKTLDRQFERT